MHEIWESVQLLLILYPFIFIIWELEIQNGIENNLDKNWVRHLKKKKINTSATSQKYSNGKKYHITKISNFFLFLFLYAVQSKISYINTHIIEHCVPNFSISYWSSSYSACLGWLNKKLDQFCRRWAMKLISMSISSKSIVRQCREQNKKRYREIKKQVDNICTCINK